MLQGKNIFITGGAGFIGSSLIGRLVEDNKITVYDNFKRNSLENRDYKDHANLSLIEGDVLDYPSLQKAMKGAQVVVHCAAIAGIDTVILHPTETIRVNLLGTAKVLEAANNLTGLERLVDFSTSEVFGQSAFRSEESDTTKIGAVGEARWTYAVSKLAAEHLTKAYHQEFGMPTVSVRPFNVYGPGQIGEGAMMKFIQLAIEDRDIMIHGDGNQIRAWCYIDDFLDGLLLALTHPNAIGESFNIGNARAVITIYGLAQTIVRVLRSNSHLRFEKRSGPDVELRVPSVDKARDLVGFQARIDLEEGISRTADYYRENMAESTTRKSGHRWQSMAESE